MVIADREQLQYQLEAMKMAQSTLQQLMTLSAGGLALFFTFIGKAPFVLGVEILGPGVVTAWIISLSAAAYAHRLHVDLYLSLARIVGVNNALDSFVDLAGDITSELRVNTNSEAVIERAKSKIESKREWLRSELANFEKSFFPAQSKTLCLTRVSLFMLVFGFVELGIAYGLSRLAT